MNIRIIENQLMADPIWKQTFTPKSKKKRIQKKARKLYTKLVGHKPWEKIFFMNKDTIICHPEIVKQIKEQIPEIKESKIWPLNL